MAVAGHLGTRCAYSADEHEPVRAENWSRPSGSGHEQGPELSAGGLETLVTEPVRTSRAAAGFGGAGNPKLSQV